MPKYPSLSVLEYHTRTILDILGPKAGHSKYNKVFEQVRTIWGSAYVSGIHDCEIVVKEAVLKIS